MKRAAIPCLLLLAACGGGGGDSPEAVSAAGPAPAAAPQRRQLQRLALQRLAPLSSPHLRSPPLRPFLRLLAPLLPVSRLRSAPCRPCQFRYCATTRWSASTWATCGRQPSR